MLITSCKPKFELLDLKLNTTNIHNVVTNDIKHDDEKMFGKYFKVTEYQKFLMLDDLQLKNQDIDSTRKNHIWFEYNKKDSIINSYQLVYYTKKENAKVVFNKLKEKMGNPNFLYYNDPISDSSTDFEAVIWEDVENKTFYMLKYTMWDNLIRELRLEVILNNETNLKDDSFSITPFYYWKDYIEARKEIKKPNYTYQEFIKNAGWKYTEHTK